MESPQSFECLSDRHRAVCGDGVICPTCSEKYGRNMYIMQNPLMSFVVVKKKSYDANKK